MPCINAFVTCLQFVSCSLSAAQVLASVVVDGKTKFDEDPGKGDNSLLSKLKDADCAVVQELSCGSRSQKAPRPYTTARLQQDASRFLGFTTKQTMSLAQSLFEGMVTDHSSTFCCLLREPVPEDACLLLHCVLLPSRGLDHLPSHRR